MESFKRDDTMYPTDPIYTVNMNDHQRAWFYAEYERARKDEVIGVLLAIFLGGLGIHHFYLRRNGLGFLYLVFSWTGIPMVIAWIEAFFMPDRVRQYNAVQAMYISSQILGATPGQPGSATAPQCNVCGNTIDPTAAFCKHCGAAVNRSGLSTQPAL
jgi:TM2 domain-containing membrane protein YozV